MEILSALLHFNKNFLNFLKEDFWNEQRDEYIEKINVLLDEREELIGNLKETNETYDSETLIQIIQSNKEIDELLNNYLQIIKGDLKRITLSKKKNKEYSNPYSHSTNLDGTFFDKRK